MYNFQMPGNLLQKPRFGERQRNLCFQVKEKFLSVAIWMPVTQNP